MMRTLPTSRPQAFWRKSIWMLLSCLLGCLQAHATLLPVERIAPWQDAGIAGGIPNYSVGVDITNYGAVGDGVTDDTQALKDAIAACPAGTAVYIPDGSYLLSSTIFIDKSIVLRGESRLGTILKMNHSDDGITVRNYSNSSGEIALTGGLSEGSTVVTLVSTPSSSSFTPGNILEIKQDNDLNVYQPGYKGYESWTDRQTAMMNEVVSVSGNQVTLKHPLLMEFATSFNPTIRAQDRVYQAGIENLKIDRILDASSGGHNIYFYAAVQCWVKDIWSEKTYGHHIQVTRSLQCEIRGNVIHDSWLDAGGQGYGIATQDRATLNLVIDNTCSGLRHSYVAQAGAAGNVFAYNFSRDPYSSLCDHCIFADLSAHGSMANHTLYEGNKVVQIFLDDVHGSNPWNTVFRNYATKPDPGYPGIHLEKTSQWCSLIGNVSGNMASTGQAIKVATEVEATTIVTGNLNGITGVTEWDSNGEVTLPDSLFLSAKPAFFGSKPWPMFGPEMGVVDTLPAEDRWYALTGTAAPAEAPVATTPIGFIEAQLSPVAYYNCQDDGSPLLSDLSGNFLNGDLNGPTFSANSSHDGSDALSFDGSNDEVVVGDQPILDFDNALTIAAWVRTNDASSHQCIVSKNNAYYIYLYGTGSGARLRVGLSIAGSWQTLTTSTANTVQSHTWTHVTATYDGSYIRVYLDGVEIGNKAASGSISSNSKDLEIGTLWNGYRWDGELDDITLFDSALDASDINLLYTGDWLNPLVPAAVADYRFEAGSGSTAIDSKNGLNGSITGASFSSDAAEGSYSLSFDGSGDEVVIADANSLDINNSLTLAAWVKTNDTSSHQCIIGKNAAYYLYLYSGSYGSRIRTGLRIDGAWVTSTSPNQSTKSIPANTWAHVAMTYDGNEILTYLDGVEINSFSQQGSIGSSNKDVELGTIWGGFHFNGLLDVVQIYDLALFPDEIVALAQ
ncbi:glycosyl hydrolase family 28-related protein [Coraliomargarita sp. SDUM461003]|uniref:Glycosyl hydrolase family 28-related protein n=2 Tax=Thalassobacterium maritimum TaxID=3041265 RepID=A0ABU1AXL5_9BACT|nr:glycosyl hydrolase family 28-related protein [Coraliomargarita sp. SDUM461003]